MKIERISDNQIRCTLTSSDLSSRNINLIELAYGTEKARRLFHEMIQKASAELGFEAEDIPLMVEAIPLSGESIMLVITKIEDPEELDTRFSKFSPVSEEDANPLLAQLADEFLEGASDNPGCLEPDTVEGAREQAESRNTESSSAGSPAVSSLRIFRFNELDCIITAAHAVKGIYSGTNTLYKKPGTRQYYLVLHRISCSDLDFSRVCNILAEYAAKLPNEYAGEAYFREHYDIIISDGALQKLSAL